jgi:hypothetical protein
MGASAQYEADRGDESNGASSGQQPSFAADESPLLILKCGVCICIPVFEAQIDRAPSRTSSVDDAFRNRERLTRSQEKRLTPTNIDLKLPLHHKEGFIRVRVMVPTVFSIHY